MIEDRREPHGAPLLLFDLIRRRKDEIVAEWERMARDYPALDVLPAPELRDELPALLQELGQRIEAILRGRPHESAPAHREHSLDRLRSGFSLQTVIHELALLQEVILRAWWREVGGAVLEEEAVALATAVSEAQRIATARYDLTRQRTLAALEDISARGAERPQPTRDAITALLNAVREHMEGIDGACYCSLEPGGERLVVGEQTDRASVDRVIELIRGNGKVVHLQLWKDRPHGLHADAPRSMYGVPVRVTDGISGVVTVVSNSAPEISSDQQIVVLMLASRVGLELLRAHTRAA